MKHTCRICNEELPELLQAIAESGGKPLCGYTVCERTGKTDAEAPRVTTQQPTTKFELSIGCVVRIINPVLMYMDAQPGDCGRVIKRDEDCYWMEPVGCDWKGEKYYVTQQWLKDRHFEIISGAPATASRPLKVGDIIVLLDTAYMGMRQAKNGERAQVVKEMVDCVEVVPVEGHWPVETYIARREWEQLGRFQVEQEAP